VLQHEQFAVPTSNNFPQQQFSSDDSPEKSTLLVHKHLLQRICEQLHPSAGYLSIERGFVEQLINDLAVVINGMDAMQSSPYASQYFRSRSIGKVFDKIRNYAWVELLSSLRYLNQGEIQEYFRCLLRCSDYLKEALMEFLI
jgi:hypothetical protein